MSVNAKFWKESASLIILARNVRHVKSDGCDYKALVLKRSSKTKFMPSGIVFPGGQIEKCDSSRDWLALYESLGVSLKNLCNVTQVNGERPPIFQRTSDSDDLQREISLRVSCIRETFEELGVLICRDKNDLVNTQNSTHFATFKSDFDVRSWQKKVHDDPTKFLELCNELKIVPDLWGTHEWSAWLTPTALKGKRFEAAFYLAALNDIPDVLAEDNEVQSYMWKSPLELLTSHIKEELWLPPPQHYEISRLAGVPEIDSVAKFAKDRSNKGTKLFFPVLVNAKDGIIHLLPGDEDYPNTPNFETGEGDSQPKVEMTMEELRPKGSIHRSEHNSTNKMKLIMQRFQPHCGHLYPVEDIQYFVNSKL